MLKSPILFILALVLALPSAFAADMPVAEILKRAASTFHVQNRRADYTLTLVDAKGADDGFRKVRVWIKKRGDDQYRLLIRALEPAGVRGIALLTHYEKSDVDQWLYVPAYRKSRRISGSGGDASFLGSEFTLDDISFARQRNYQWKRLPDAVHDGRKCFVLEGTRELKPGESGASKRVNWIDAETFKTLKAEIFNRDGKVERELRSEDKKLTMKNLVTGRASRLQIDVSESKEEIPDSLFLPAALER